MLKCPQCGNPNHEVKDSRPTGEFGGSVRRRRFCPQCEHRFTTKELTEDQIARLINNACVSEALIHLNIASDVLKSLHRDTEKYHGEAEETPQVHA